MTAELARLKRRLPWTSRRVRTRTVLQLEASECGAASLAMILAYHGRYVPLDELRKTCGVSRDGSKATNILKAAKQLGMAARGFKKEVAQLGALPLPMILFWNFDHFLVLEGLDTKTAYLNDPAVGRRRVALDEFSESYTGVALTFEPLPDFARGGRPPAVLDGLIARLAGVRGTLLFVLLASIALIVPALMLPAFTRFFIDFVAIQQLDAWLTPLMLAMAGTALISGVLVLIEQRALARMRTALALRGASDFLWHVLRLPIEYFAQRYAIEVAGRIALTGRMASLLSGQLATTLLSLASIVVFAAIMVQYNVLLTVVGVAFALVNVIGLWLVSRRLLDVSRAVEVDDGKLRANTFHGLAMIESLKATGTENLFLGRWAGYHAKAINAEQSFGRTQVFLGALPAALAGISSAAIIIVGGLRVMDGVITIGMLLGFRALMTMFSSPVRDLVQFGGLIQEAAADVERLDDVQQSALDPGFRGSDQTSVAPLSGALQVRNLSYGYAPLDAPLIAGFNLDLAPGDRVALVGGSGSGKSTIGKLLAGIYHPWEGSIRFDGVGISDVARLTLRRSVAYVDQDTALMTGTIRDNIGLWDPTLAEPRLVKAARAAMIHDDIARRPGGYDHLVAEDGRNFSGGQRQRLMLARALVQDPSLIILDEATSALDPLTELAFMTALRQRGCSVVVIAHRLSTIRDCDEILFVRRGTIVERGRHDDLIALDGEYRRLVET